MGAPHVKTVWIDGKESKPCSLCGETKPLTEFHPRNDRPGKLQSRCMTCVNDHSGRPATPRKVNTRRAHERALAELKRRHRAEFDELYREYLVAVEQEAAHIEAAAPAEAKHHGPVRLRPGPRKQGQKVTDRIDVARCPHCIGHHDRGHTCQVCGAKPGEPLRETRSANRVTAPRGIDPAALAEFNAGTARAAQ